MDPRIWSRLPDHLLERVLSFLPLKSFLNLRSTCKFFSSLLYSPSFMSKHFLSSLSSFILLSHPQFLQKCPIFNSSVNSWCSISVSFPQTLSSLSSSTLLSSSNGLLCFSIPESSCFVVCNLLTKRTRKLKFPFRPFDFELPTLVCIPDHGYKLFVLSPSANSALVYDSKLDSWKRFEGFDPVLNDNCHQKGVLLNGSLFFTTPEPFAIVDFDLETGKWEKSRIDLPEGLTFARLVNDGENKITYLIGGVGVSGISRSIKLWEFRDDGGENWVEIETVPEMVCRKFLSVCYHNYEHVYCFWHQGLICVCCYTWPEILYYRVSRRTWHWLPKCPSLPEKWSCGFRKGYTSVEAMPEAERALLPPPKTPLKERLRRTRTPNADYPPYVDDIFERLDAQEETNRQILQELEQMGAQQATMDANVLAMLHHINLQPHPPPQ